MTVEYPRDKVHTDAIYTGTWSEKNIPVYTALSIPGYTALVGKVKNLNKDKGTVLCRGQCDLYPHVLPSAARDNAENKKRQNELITDVVNKIATRPDLLEFWDLNRPEIFGWKIAQSLAIEATLQHYGAKTFCVDFVDNYYLPLFFGLYRWNNDARIYEKRNSAKHSDEDRCIVFSSIHRDHKIAFDADNKQGHMYVILYVAETKYPLINGIYQGESTYVVDLREALPYSFSRPCNQSGWIVKGKNDDYCFDDHIACVIRISIDLVTSWLGNAKLFDVNEIFPSELEDKGYAFLLNLQMAPDGTGDTIIPQNTIDLLCIQNKH